MSRDRCGHDIEERRRGLEQSCFIEAASRDLNAEGQTVHLQKRQA